MEYKEALRISRRRAHCAARALQGWTGVETRAIVAVKDAGPARRFEGVPVGLKSWKDIDPYMTYWGCIGYLVTLVDEDGAQEACIATPVPLRDAIQMAEKVPLPVTPSGDVKRLLEKRAPAASGSQAPAESPSRDGRSEKG